MLIHFPKKHSFENLTGHALRFRYYYTTVYLLFNSHETAMAAMIFILGCDVICTRPFLICLFTEACDKALITKTSSGNGVMGKNCVILCDLE